MLHLDDVAVPFKKVLQIVLTILYFQSFSRAGKEELHLNPIGSNFPRYVVISDEQCKLAMQVTSRQFKHIIYENTLATSEDY